MIVVTVEGVLLSFPEGCNGGRCTLLKKGCYGNRWTVLLWHPKGVTIGVIRHPKGVLFGVNIHPCGVHKHSASVH